jgi:molybdopterin-guanine dinucleotide biosynthesis protein A
LKLSHIEAAVLCGGASTRMGRDKAMLRYRG